MVHSVSAVSTTRKVTRDSHNKTASNLSENKSDHTFSGILEEKVDEQKMSTPNCHTVTYGNDMKIHTFLYQAREYHY